MPVTPHIKMTLKGYLIAGLLIWLPLAVTLWVLNLIVGTLDQTLTLLPEHLRPEALFGVHVPGLGVIFAVLVLMGTGMLAANVLGRRLVDFWHGLLSRTPVVRSIYNSVKQVSDTLFSDSGNAFKNALLVRWPHQNAWCVAFQTGTPAQQVLKYAADGEELVSVYVPTTPNPTSGYFIVVPRSDTRELDMSVDDALKYVISMGVVVPNPPPEAQRPRLNDEHNRQG